MSELFDKTQIILLVEDDPNDALLCQKALSQAGASRVIRLHDGEDAIKYLAGSPPFDDRSVYPLPALVLLDLKMPKITGFEVLAWLQGHPELTARVPVVVLTGSIYPEDKKKAERLGAVGYEVKPVSFTELIRIAKKTLPAGEKPS